jgi:mevalonate kinase
MQRSVTATAPGKVIIFGEHAVVYGQPAIAAPVHQAQTTATVEPARPGSGLILSAVDLDMVISLAQAPDDDPLAAIARLTLAHLGAPAPDATLTVRSTIPIASGMGSGAAVSTAVVRALAVWMGRELRAETVSSLVYEVEKLHHGTPSGIDNTVVAFGMPVYFVRGQPIKTFSVGAALHFLVADTGVASSTRVVVGDVRRAWEADTAHYEALFAQVGELARQARELIEAGGETARLGALMNRNHGLLRDIGVSSVELERLVLAAREAGALGTKLSGAGRGGNMIALLRPGDQERVAQALRQAGAVRVIETELPASEGVNAAFNGAGER